jgi:2Fe-2S ferredoxin
MVTHVRVEGTGRVFRIHPGEDLLEVLQSHGEPIATSCGGVALCGTCRVIVVSGRDALVPIKAQEIEHLGDRTSVAVTRLACQAQLRPGDPSSEVREIVVRIPEGVPSPP